MLRNLLHGRESSVRTHMHRHPGSIATCFGLRNSGLQALASSLTLLISSRTPLPKGRKIPRFESVRGSQTNQGLAAFIARPFFMDVPHSYHAEHQHAQAAQLLNVSEHKAKAYRGSGDFPTDTVSRYGQYTRNGAPPCIVAPVPRRGFSLHDRFRTVTSTSRCNTLAKSFRWCFEV